MRVPVRSVYWTDGWQEYRLGRWILYFWVTDIPCASGIEEQSDGALGGQSKRTERAEITRRIGRGKPGCRQADPLP